LFLFFSLLVAGEGTTNVLSHDLLRVLSTTKGHAFRVFQSVVSRRLAALESAQLPEALRSRQAKIVASLRLAHQELAQFLAACLGAGGKDGGLALESQARALAFAVSRVYIASTLSVHFLHTKDYADFVTLERWTLEGDNKQATAISPLIPATLRARQLFATAHILGHVVFASHRGTHALLFVCCFCW
jgi:hypothetical protein